MGARAGGAGRSLGRGMTAVYSSKIENQARKVWGLGKSAGKDSSAYKTEMGKFQKMWNQAYGKTDINGYNWAVQDASGNNPY